MELSTIIAFTLATLAIGASPGPGVIAVSAQSMKSGIRPGMVFALGVMTGDLIFLLFVLLGLMAVAEALGVFFIVVRYLGAAYLIYLGVRMWLTRHDTIAPNETKRGASSTYLSGLAVTLGNPKAMLFHVGFIPAFWDLTQLTFLQGLMIVFIVMLSLLLVFSTYVLVANQSRRFMTQGRKKLFDRVAGSFLIWAGYKVARS